MNVNNTIERKICDYFNGKLSATEEAELIQWLQFSEENEAYFRSYKEKIDPQEIEHPLLQSSFSELKNKLLINQEFNTRNSTGIKKLQLSFARIAAMLLVAVITRILDSLSPDWTQYPKSRSCLVRNTCSAGREVATNTS